jgi:hypothetical protein
VVGLDRRGVVAAAGLDHVRVEGALDEEVDLIELRRLLLEDADELLADDLALGLGVVLAGELGEKALLGFDVDQRDAELLEGLDHLLGLVHPHQAVVTKDAVSLSPTALWTAYATEESTPPERPQIPKPSPTWAWILDLFGDHRPGRPRSAQPATSRRKRVRISDP